MHSARLLIGVALVLSPVLCGAQEADSSTGSVVTEHAVDSGALLLGRLDAVAEGGLALDAIDVPGKARAAWLAETERYAERTTELRSRCHEEIRKANRDTIVEKSAQCLRSNLLLEITHRRKQRELFDATPGIDPAVLDAVHTSIDAFITVATASVDGVDAGVFTNVELMKESKRNLHAIYRVPMLETFVRARSSRGLALTRGLALAVRGAVSTDAVPHAFLDAFVPCIESTASTFATGASTTGDASHLRAGLTQLRACVDLADDAR